MGTQMFVERRQRPLANFHVAKFAVARWFLELRQQIEGDVSRLIVRRIRARDVRAQRTDGSLARKWPSPLAPRHETGGDRFDVSFDARDLSGEENVRHRAQLKRGSEQGRPIDVSIAMHLAVAEELRIR